MKNKYLKYTLSVALGLVAISFIASFWWGWVKALRVVFGSVWVLFLPGFVLSLVFFGEGEIDVIERIALSFALSISIVPLLVFYLNLVGMKITALNVSLVIAGVLLTGLIGVWRKRAKELKG